MPDREYDARRPSGDLIVTPGDYVYILDETKGIVSVIVGPQKMSLAGTDKPVVFDEATSQFRTSDPENALRRFISAPRGSYVELQNPAKSEGQSHPPLGTIGNGTDLQHGCKINIAGPVHCALWPGQVANVLEGHNLRSNQYLICRVYDDDAASANIDEAVIKTAEEGESKDASKEERKNLLPSSNELVTGKRFIIKGTDVSFFIPPNGIEVSPDGDGNYIRSAVTIEQLEYCILLDENGNKRFERGPQVVFPTPTERFLKRTPGKEEHKRSAPDIKRASKTTRRFRAIELNDISGIYVKVTSPYTDDGVEYKEGKELFITGKEQRIYFPRAEHSIIKYGERDVHFAVAIPAGDAKYVMNKETGIIDTVKGPKMFLADPRKEVIVRRIVSEDKLNLWYPGNSEAIEYNASLRDAASGESDGFVTDRQYRATRGGRQLIGGYSGGGGAAMLSAGTAGSFDDDAVHNSDSFERRAKFTKPVTVTLDDKFDGAIRLQVWTGYAVQVINGVGDRRVVTGPAVAHLGYDEQLESFFVSKGTPKDAHNTKRDVYLRVLNNRVSDKVVVETADMVKVELTTSYRVNFTGDPNAWFNVENYVQHLVDNCRSILRNVAKSYDIQAFYNDYINIVRNMLTPSSEDGVRAGRLFEENGMLITEVEVLGCTIGDSEIQSMLEDAQRDTAASLISINQGRKQLELDTENAELKKARAKLDTETSAFQEEESRKRLLSEEETSLTRHKLRLNEFGRSHQTSVVNIENEDMTEKLAIESDLAQQRLRTDGEIERGNVEDQADLARQEILDTVNAAELSREKAGVDLRLSITETETLDYIKRLEAEAAKEEIAAGAITPGLVEALQSLAQSDVLEKISKDLAPLAIVRGQSIGGAIEQLFEGTALAPAVARLTSNIDPKKTNGSGGVSHEERRSY